MDTERKPISVNDDYRGDDFEYWGNALMAIANHYGQRVDIAMGWVESFDEGKTPIEAFLEEYPEHASPETKSDV